MVLSVKTCELGEKSERFAFDYAAMMLVVILAKSETQVQTCFGVIGFEIQYKEKHLRIYKLCLCFSE